MEGNATAEIVPLLAMLGERGYESRVIREVRVGMHEKHPKWLYSDHLWPGNVRSVRVALSAARRRHAETINCHKPIRVSWILNPPRGDGAE